MLSAIQVYVSVAWLVICYTLIYQVYILWDIYHMLACDTLSCHCEDSFMFVKKKKRVVTEIVLPKYTISSITFHTCLSRHQDLLLGFCFV
jgi:hypothetical protein